MIHATVKKLLRTRNVFLTALFIGLFAMAARNVTDPDIWWHLKTGQYIAETQKRSPHRSFLLHSCGTVLGRTRMAQRPSAV